VLGVGLALHPEPELLLVARRAIEELADFYEISPELHWLDATRPSTARAQLLHLVQASGKPTVGHGLFTSLGTPPDPARSGPLRELLAADQAAFGFSHYSEHLGWTCEGGLEAVLPLPLPPSEASARVVAENLRALKELTPRVAFENGAFLTPIGDPTLEPDFLRRICDLADCDLLLDLHNAYANCLNTDTSLEDWLTRVPWERVIQIHLSGGSQSEPDWLRSGATRRLDSHDAPVPEPVWAAYQRALSWAPRLEGVVLEWLGLREDQAAAHEQDLRRARELWATRPARPTPPAAEPRPLHEHLAPAEVRLALTEILHSRDPVSALEARLAAGSALARETLGGLDPEGLRLTQLIVKRLRFERVLQGHSRCRAEFQADPEGFTARFRAYDDAGPSRSPWPSQEAAAFLAS